MAKPTDNGGWAPDPTPEQLELGRKLVTEGWYQTSNKHRHISRFPPGWHPVKKRILGDQWLRCNPRAEHMELTIDEFAAFKRAGGGTYCGRGMIEEEELDQMVNESAHTYGGELSTYGGEMSLTSGKPRKFGPKQPNHPSIGEVCPACKVRFKEGDYTTLVVIGPGDDEEAQRKAKEGHAYNAVAIEAHWACVTGEYDDQPPEVSHDSNERTDPRL